MQRVNKVVYQKLKAILPAGTKIYPAIAENDAEYPFVIYNMNSFSTDYDKDSDDRHCSYTIEIRSDNFDECDGLADSIDLGLRGCIGAGVYSLIESGSSGYDNSYYQQLNFDIDIDG